jgi:hypothetical protein
MRATPVELASGMFADRFAIFEESFFASPADDQQGIECFNDAAARLRSTIQSQFKPALVGVDQNRRPHQRRRNAVALIVLAAQALERVPQLVAILRNRLTVSSMRNLPYTAVASGNLASNVLRL